MARFEAYPLTFLPRLEAKVWGGRRLGRYGKRLPPGGKIGESWEISDVPGKPTEVANGPYAGRTLRDLMAAHAAEIVGEGAGGAAAADGAQPAPRRAGGEEHFPLLVKLLHSEQNLSVQVHPADDDVREAGLGGKTEAWVILEADAGARVLHGLAPGVQRQVFFDRMEAAGRGPLARGEAASLFRWVEVAAGDVIHVPAGTVHTIGKGIVLLEVQQTSDVTYRIHDWGRDGDRDLHLREARAVSRARPVRCPSSRLADAGPGRFSTLVRSEHFRLEAAAWGPGSGAAAPRALRASTRGRRGAEFHILAGIAGEATLRPAAGEEIGIRSGAFVLLPAALGSYEVELAGESAIVLRTRG